jgi:peptide/nickel transport system substrate-binding protein
MKRVFARALALSLVGVTLLTSCATPSTPSAPPAGGAPSGGAAPTAAPAPAQRKALTIGVQEDFANLVTPLDVTGTKALPTRFMHQFIHSYLTVRNANNDLTPLLAERLPSLDDGSWKVSDDGTMEVTWRLRQGVKWHDGTPMTSDDVRFGYEVIVDTNTPIGVRSPLRSLSRLETPDPYTVVMYWSVSSQNGNELSERELDVLPRHLLGAAFEADRVGFQQHPWITQPEAFVGLGPYRPLEWIRGTQLTLEAYPDFFLGRPKIDRVVFRPISDAQTMLANLLSGHVDMAYQNLTIDGTKTLQEEWARTNGGTIVQRPVNMLHLLPQFRAEFARPVELADPRDPRLRRSLAYGFDRAEAAEAVGLPRDFVAHSVTVPGTPEFEAVERTLMKYPYDPNRAMGLLQELGYQRGTDGMLTRNGQPFQFGIRTSSGIQSSVAAIQQQNYKRIGIDAQIMTAGAPDAQAEAEYPGVNISSIPVSPIISWSNRWHTRQVSGPNNRYAGTNFGGYSNPATDQAIVSLERALRREDQLRYWAETWRQISEDVGVIPIFFTPIPLVARRGVVGWEPKNPLGDPAYGPWTWDIQ